MKYERKLFIKSACSNGISKYGIAVLWRSPLVQAFYNVIVILFAMLANQATGGGSTSAALLFLEPTSAG